LNIKERVVNGERHTYVLELILAMRGQGWLWTEEYIWHKKILTRQVAKSISRRMERLIQFNKNRKFKMFQETVMTPWGLVKNKVKPFK